MVDHGRDQIGAQDAVELLVPARAGELAGLRRAIRSYVESAGGEPATADDLELVVSELATNVIDHTTSPTISIRLERTPLEWLLDVADVGERFVLPDVPQLPPTSEPTGRGLFIVRSLVDDVEIVETSTSRMIRCRRTARD